MVKDVGRRPDAWLAALLFGASLALRLWPVITTGFDGLYGQDSYAYYGFAQELQETLPQGQSPGPFFWPLGYPALLATAFTLFGLDAQVGQALNMLLGASLAPLVYLLARQSGARRPGALAGGAIMAVSGQAWQSSIVLMADIPALAWATFSALALWRYVDNARARWLFLAALMLAVASVTRWVYLGLALPWGLALLFTWRGLIRWRMSLVALLVALGILLPQMAFSRSNPVAALHLDWLEIWTPLNAFEREFVTVEGRQSYITTNAVYYARPFYDLYYLAPMLTPLLLLGIATLLRRRHYGQLSMLLGWVAVPYVFLIGIPIQNIRYPLIMVPGVAILAGWGVEALFDYWPESFGRVAPKLRYASRLVLAAWVLIGLGYTLIHSRGVIDNFVSSQQRDKDVAQWVNANVSPDSNLYAFGLTLTLRHYTRLTVRELYYETPQSLAADWLRGRDDYLLLDVVNVEGQWAGREPQIAYSWLREMRGLQELGRYANFTLFRVQR